MKNIECLINRILNKNKVFRLIIVLITLVLLLSCKKSEKENYLEGPLNIENKDGKYLLFNQNELATGILKGKDLILGLNYNMYYSKGKPTGKIIYFNDTQKMMEVNVNFDFEKDIAVGEVNIFEYNGNKVPIVGMQYRNIKSQPINFIDLKNARPTLRWYLENPVNIFSQVDILNRDKKISSIKDKKYYFYDEEGIAYEVPMIKKNILTENDLIYSEEDEVLLLNGNDEKISYNDVGKAVKKVKVNSIIGTGILKEIDEYDNVYMIEYNLGIPTGNFEIDTTGNGNFKIFGTGKYNSNTDEWSGEIEIYTEDENIVELKNMKILAKYLFSEKNIINYSWISIKPTVDEPIDKNNINNIEEAEIYFNNKMVGKIVNGLYKEL